MRVEPFNLREFDAPGGARPVIAKTSAGGIAPLLSSGKRKDVPPPPPTFSEDQLKAAEMESYKKGFADGVKEGRLQQENEQGEIERKLAVTVERFTTALDPVLKDYREIVLQVRQELPRVAMAIARKAAGQALTENYRTLVEDIALRCAEIMIGEPRLSVVVHASVADLLKQKLDALAAKYQAVTDIVIIGDASIPEADCRIEWKQGAFARDNLHLWQSIEQAVAGMVASGRHDAIMQAAAVASEAHATLENPINPKE